MKFFGRCSNPWLHRRRSATVAAGGDLTSTSDQSNGTAFNIWQAKLDHPFEVYEPGLHHVAFNVQRHEQVE